MMIGLDSLKLKVKQSFCKHGYRFSNIAHDGFTLYHIYTCYKCNKTKAINKGK